jgi:hypothetical protein
MDPDDITFDDLLDDEPAASEMPRNYAQLHADGFPRGGGLAALAAIQGLDDPDPRFASLQDKYRRLLELQQRESANASGQAMLSDNACGPLPSPRLLPT